MYTFKTKVQESDNPDYNSIMMYPFKGWIKDHNKKKQRVEFESFNNSQTITTLNFIVNGKDIESNPIVKPFSLNE